MGDWDADPQREAYQRAVGDYIEFAKIVQHYDRTARPAHDDIDFEAGDLAQLDGEELDIDGNPVIQCAIYLIAIDEDDDPWDHPEYDATHLIFDDYDDFAKYIRRCRRRTKDDE